MEKYGVATNQDIKFCKICGKKLKPVGNTLSCEDHGARGEVDDYKNGKEGGRNSGSPR